MISSNNSFLRVLAGERIDPPPVWFMRQAGRYLDEYRATRTEAGSFLDLVYDPVRAAEVTLQPIRRFGFDAAILFSDILVVPQALGQKLWFEDGEGPRLAPPLAQAELKTLSANPDVLTPIYQTIRLLCQALPADVPLIGFAGSPWTVATYMATGRGSKDQAVARRMAYGEPQRFAELIAAITDMTIHYLDNQVKAGAQAVQLFDSWCGVLAPAPFQRWVIEPTARIVAALKNIHPHVPIIGFPRGAGAKIIEYARETHVDALGLDETMDPRWAHANLPPDLPVQGNLDAVALLTGGAALDDAIDSIVMAFAGRPHIFNLGHGITPDVPVAHIHAAIARLRKTHG
jgi:uroporphyrinogen decarboxylase